MYSDCSNLPNIFSIILFPPAIWQELRESVLICFIAVCQYWGIYLILLTKISKTLVNRHLTLVCLGNICLLSISRAYHSSQVIHAHMGVMDLYFIELTVKILYQFGNIFVPSYIIVLFYITVILLKFSSGLSEFC